MKAEFYILKAGLLMIAAGVLWTGKIIGVINFKFTGPFILFLLGTWHISVFSFKKIVKKITKWTSSLNFLEED